MRGRAKWIGIVAAMVALAMTASVSVAEPVNTRDGVVAAHETLKAAVEAGDVEAARSTLNTLSPLLTELSSERSLASESRELAAEAGQELSAATAELAARDLPTVPEMLSMLLQRLLILLAELVYNLLGGPLPLPVPAPMP